MAAVASPIAIHCIRRIRDETLGVPTETLTLSPATLIGSCSGRHRSPHGSGALARASPCYHQRTNTWRGNQPPRHPTPYFTSINCPRTAPLGKFLLWTLT